MDAQKVLNRIKEEYLFYKLKHMNFGEAFKKYIKIMYRSHKAQVQTNATS